MLIKSKKRVLISFYMTDNDLMDNVSNLYVKGNKKVLSEHYYFKKPVKEDLQIKESTIETDKTVKTRGATKGTVKPINTQLRTSQIYY